jgi:transposase-like protein
MEQAKQIEAAALDAALTITEVCRQAGVSPHTFYHSKRTGRNMKPVTEAKLRKAIADLSQ